MSATERIVEGRIVEVLPHALYRIDAGPGPDVIAHVSEETRVAAVHLRPGQSVRVAVSAYDSKRGRILGRVE